MRDRRLTIYARRQIFQNDSTHPTGMASPFFILLLIIFSFAFTLSLSPPKLLFGYRARLGLNNNLEMTKETKSITEMLNVQLSSKTKAGARE